MWRFVRKQNDEDNEQTPQEMEDVPISGPRKNSQPFFFPCQSISSFSRLRSFDQTAASLVSRNDHAWSVPRSVRSHHGRRVGGAPVARLLARQSGREWLEHTGAVVIVCASRRID